MLLYIIILALFAIGVIGTNISKSGDPHWIISTILITLFGIIELVIPIVLIVGGSIWILTSVVKAFKN